ncbi:MAG TPA: nuclear transport factor 2 family protein [Planctomycetes bacterium]|nr:nuclear transport factor 2 family protein [Fuerstiella sp.]HIK95701.1 nuclear transport factor 2 family protein [Planctomycetota bacterium]
MKRKIIGSFAVAWLAVASLAAMGQDAATENEKAAAEVSAAIQSYIAAFNARDVDKLVSHWSPQGVYISRNTGERVIGHEALTAEFAGMFAGANILKLAGTTESIELISPNVVLERGTATVTREKTDIVQSSYSVVYVKSGKKWLIDRVTNEEIIVQPSNYQHLKELEWLVGEWIDEGDGISIQVACWWTKNQNYLSRTYSVSNDQGVASTGLQIIGWDPRAKQIRSWLFDSDGGFIKGTWARRDDRWVVQAVATLPDGATGSFTSIFRPTEEGAYTWEKINRVLDGQLLPNVDEIVVRRK